MVLKRATIGTWPRINCVPGFISTHVNTHIFTLHIIVVFAYTCIYACLQWHAWRHTTQLIKKVPHCLTVMYNNVKYNWNGMFAVDVWANNNFYTLRQDINNLVGRPFYYVKLYSLKVTQFLNCLKANLVFLQSTAVICYLWVNIYADTDVSEISWYESIYQPGRFNRLALVQTNW